MECDLHDDILRIGDTKSDVKLRLSPLQHLGIGRSFETTSESRRDGVPLRHVIERDGGQTQIKGFVGLVHNGHGEPQYAERYGRPLDPSSS